MDSNQNEQESWQQALDAPISFLPSVLHQLGLDREQADASGSINERLAALHDSDWRVRVSALRALEAWGTHVPQVELVQALDDEDGAVRAAAVHALGMLGEQAPVERLVSALQDSDWHVRETAVLVLGNLGAHVPERSLVLAMKDSDSMVREAASLVLHQRHAVVVSAVEPEESRSPYEASTTYSIIMEDSDLMEAHADKYVQFSQADTLQRWEPPRKRSFLRSHLILLVVCAVLLIGAVNVTVWLGFVYSVHLPPSSSVINVKAVPTSMPYLPKETPTVIPPLQGTPGVAGSAGQTVYTYYGQTASISGVAWSPDGTRIASGSADGTLTVWEAFTGQTIFRWSNPNQNSISGVAWSPDGKYLAVGGTDSNGANVYILYAGNGKIASICLIGPVTPQASGVHIGALRATSGGGPGTVSSLAWSPDSLRVAAAIGNGTVQVFNALTGAELGTSGTPTSLNAIASSISWSPDGQYIAYTVGPQLMLWNTTNGQLSAHKPAITNGWVTSVAWSPDNQHLAVGVAQLGVGNVAAEIWNPFTGTDHYYKKRFVGRWSPNSAYIAGADTAQNVQIWDATNGNIIFAYADKAGRVTSLAWSPDGSYIASGDYRGVVNVWRTP